MHITRFRSSKSREIVINQRIILFVRTGKRIVIFFSEMNQLIIKISISRYDGFRMRNIVIRIPLERYFLRMEHDSKKWIFHMLHAGNKFYLFRANTSWSYRPFFIHRWIVEIAHKCAPSLNRQVTSISKIQVLIGKIFRKIIIKLWIKFHYLWKLTVLLRYCKVCACWIVRREKSVLWMYGLSNFIGWFSCSTLHVFKKLLSSFATINKNSKPKQTPKIGKIIPLSFNWNEI